MTASELVDLTERAALVTRPGDVWLSGRSWTRPHWTVDELEAAKAGRTISVVLPALNEEDTVESVIDSISSLVGGLVDELIVLDSGSTDDTEIRAIAAGARVVTREQALPEIAPRPGKGEVLWRSLAATSGDIVVFVDSDLIDPHSMFVPRLLGPLLTEDGIHLVKSFYRRPLNVSDASGREGATGGGRVTELVARPLLAALRPELGCVLQPLETLGCSGRRNCNMNLDDLRWDRPDLDCEPEKAGGIPRNLQLDETRVGALLLAAALIADIVAMLLALGVLALFGGRSKPVMAHLVESGKLTLEDVKEAEQAIRRLAKPKAPGKEGR